MKTGVKLIREEWDNDKQIPMAFEGETEIKTFQDSGLRRVFHKNEWWFSVKDIIEALIDTPDGTDYIGKLRRRDKGLDEGYRQIVETLEFGSNGGRQKTNFVNIEGIFRIMQSVPSKKAEPFKKWLV